MRVNFGASVYIYSIFRDAFKMQNSQLNYLPIFKNSHASLGIGRKNVSK